MKNRRSCWLFTTFGIVLMTTATVVEPGQPDEDGPIIETNPNFINENKDVIVQKGQNFTITCKGDRPLDIRQQITREDRVNVYTGRLEDGNDVNYTFVKHLHLYNVDMYDVGYYACFDDTVNSNSLLLDIVEEPTDTEHIAFIYVFVIDDGPEPQLFAPMTEIAIQVNDSHVVLQCKPTMPDVDMILNMTHKTPEIVKFSPKIGFLVQTSNDSDDEYQCNGTRGNQTSSKYLQKWHVVPTACKDIEIVRDSKYFMGGDNFTLNCSVSYQHNGAIGLVWSKGNMSLAKSINDTNELMISPGQRLYNAITIVNASRVDEGDYTCTCKTGSSNKNNVKSEIKDFLENARLKISTQNEKINMMKNVGTAAIKFEIDSYPMPDFTFFSNGQILPVQYTKTKKCNHINAVKYGVLKSTKTNDVTLTICNFTVYDNAIYTLVANNNYLVKNISVEVRKDALPKVELLPKGSEVLHELHQRKSLQCKAVGYPLPQIEWIYTTGDGKNHTIPSSTDELPSGYQINSNITSNPEESGNLTCRATNKIGSTEDYKRILVYELSKGFGIVNKEAWYPQGHNVSIKCLATIYEYDDLFWRGPHGNEIVTNVKRLDNKLSLVSMLEINRIALKDNGTYTCVARKFNGSEEHENTEVYVKAIRAPRIIKPEMDKDEMIEKFLSVNISCIADAVPLPTLLWYKDGIMLKNDTQGVTIFYHQHDTVANSTIFIEKMRNDNEGQYACSATNEKEKIVRYINLKVALQPAPPYRTGLISGVIAVMLILIVLIIYLMWKVNKEKRFRKDMADAGLLHFKKGVTKSLNPDLGIDEQAELLPYNDKFEFPVEKLTLGKQLGCGAFGVVYKAEARGMNNAEESTTVAVKMVKKTADNMFIKALASELKIMVHLGVHVNIVNLLGACTKNVGKRELIIIVEYCKYGNIHNYMQKHREVFIDQLTDNKEKNLGRVNRGYSCSSASSGMNSDYFGNHSQATEHTVVNTMNTNRSERKVSEAGYVQPEWRSNYESDYSFDGRSPRPLTSRDLLAWAFQIARGMEYLASRKILHGDLAARNVLLADDNVVKICDFGLAKSIYKNDEYQKKENSPLPVKWLAIECMTDRIFTTQSDVWAFGIVLWEMFSLAKTPYPNMSPQALLQWLQRGHRLEKPPYADDRLYDVMLKCWECKPTARPSFTHLQELLGSFLEDNVRNHYVDLNSEFVDSNVRTTGEDYLAMVSAPDYNNLVTPSPHHYVNEVRSFFPPTPTQVPLDEEGYLQMTPVNKSICSPRVPSTRFDFDPKKLEPRIAETRGGSELTPMLTLNNLPARSESESDHDHEHEGGCSPYLKMCPRITEEPNDVFTPNENNEKNIQNGAVTNPTYISLDLDIDKKPQDINSYINIPNGLVK